MGRYGWFVASALVVAALPAFGRSWSDDQGHSVEGEFVRMLKGRVVISVSGRMIQVPFGHLSTEDQDFVREQMESHGLGSQLPAKKKTAASDTSSQPKSPEKQPASDEGTKLGPERSWTDVLGRSVRARLIGMDDAKVVLQVKGKTSSFPFDKFSVADQQYVREEMTSRGEGDKVPKVAPPANIQPAPEAPQVVQAGPPAGIPTMPRVGPPRMPRPTFPAMPRMPEIKFPTITPLQPIRPTPAPTPIVSAPIAPAPIAPAPMPAPRFAPVIPARPAPITPPSLPNYQPNTQVAGKVCSHCNHVVPDNLTAGDRCPYCGVYFEIDKTNGKRADWVYYTTPAGIGSLVIMVVIVLVRVARNSGTS